MLLLWGFYVLFLEKESMHHTKRFYLIFSVIFALSIPLITFTYETTVEAVPETFQQPITTMVLSDRAPVIVAPSIDYTSILLWSIYSIGVLIFGFRFIKNLKNLRRKIKINEQLKEPSHINVLLGDSIIPHTFLKYIFVSKKEYQEKNIPEEVLLHEKTHVVQKHTLDILFIEVLQVIFWFNPLLIWIKKAIKLNHEFLADQTVLKRQFSLQTYMNLLVTYPNSSNQTELSSPINYSLTKKRIIMMSKQFSKTRAAARLLLLLPILLICMLLFNNEIVAQQTNVNYTKTVQDTHPDKKIKVRVSGTQVNVNGISTNLKGFAKTIDELTKQWKDDELTEFHFDIKISNSDDRFVEKLNNEYRTTRLYKANPDGHDLIPPPPPLPPRVKKGQISNIPLPPAPRVRKGEKSNIPPPPAPPVAPKVKKGVKSSIPAPPSPPNYSHTEQGIEGEAEQAMIEAEQARFEAEIEQEYEMHSAMKAAENAKEIAMQEVEMAREMAMFEAEEAREAAERARMMAMERAQRVREQSHLEREEARQRVHQAREQAEVARAMAMEEARKARERVRQDQSKLREEARQHAEIARKEAEKAQKEARKEAQKARGEVRKEAEKARKQARKAMEKARKEQQKSREKMEKDRN